jgi:hypothetical protein
MDRSLPSGLVGTRSDWLLRQIERAHLILVGVAVLVASPLRGVGATVGVLLGGALIAVNVWLFKQLFGFLVRRAPGRRRLAITLLFAKLPLLWAGFWLIARSRIIPIDGLGLAAGISCFPVAVVVVTLTWHREPGVR